MKLKTKNTTKKIGNQVEALFENNKRTVDGHTFTVPSPTTYPYQWLWDSCFHAIVLSKFDNERAKEELRSLISKQYHVGMLPHMIYWEPSDKINIDWGKENLSTITQPPIIALAALRVYATDNDKSFLEEIYRSLKHFYDFLLRERMGDEGLIGIINPDESGEDNSPRFDNSLSLPPTHTLDKNMETRLGLVSALRECQNKDDINCVRKSFWVYDTPYNSFMIENLECMAKIAEELEKNEDKEKFLNAANSIYKAMRANMLENGIFYSVDGNTNEKIYTKTWAIFAPLATGILSQEEAKRLAGELLDRNGDFFTKYLIPTVGTKEPEYDPKGFWRGPIWHGVNWFMYRGFKRYGFEDLAERIKEDTLELINKSGFREYYHPQTGEGMGAKDFTWGALVLDMMEDE